MSKKGKKPTPKTQKELWRELHETYDKSRGNPNDGGVNYSNRGNHLSHRGDTSKPLSLGLKDNTEAILYYIENVIDPYIIQNGVRMKVPIIYGDAERWKQIQKDGFLRDKEGKIMLPLITFKRSGFEPNRGMSNKMDYNTPHNFKIFRKRYNKKNSYSNFNVLNNSKPQTQYHAVVIPDYITLTYDFIISTYYMEQMDKILESINSASGSYWGEPERYKFVASVPNFSTPIEVNTQGERVVQSSFSLKVSGYIIPEINSKELSSLRKFNNKNRVVITTETTGPLKR